MKICFLSTSFDEGYGGQHLFALAKGLAEKGVDVHVVVPSSPNSKNLFDLKNGVKIHRFKYFFPKKYQKLTSGQSILDEYNNSFIAKLQLPFFLLSFILKTLKVARKSDLIHANWTLAGIPGLIAKKLYKKKLLLSEHGAGIRSMPKFLNRFILKNLDGIISSSVEQDDIIRYLGWKEKIYDIKNISDTKRFEKRVNTNKFKSEYKLNNDPIVTFLARLVPFKDPITFVKSIPIILKKNPRVKFLMVGDGPLRNKIISLIKKNKLEKNVFLLGKRDDVNVILQASTIYAALGPKSNLFSGGIREAMISKVPCIITKAVTDFGKIYEPIYYRHKEYAYLIPKEGPNALADAVLVLLKDKVLRKKLSENGPKFLDEFGFKKDIVIEQTIDLYKKLINKLS